MWRLAALAIGLLACEDGSTPPALFETNRVWGGNLAVRDGRVYTTTFGEACGSTDTSDHGVWSFALDGTDEQRIFCGAPHRLFGFGMAVDGGRVFWSSDGEQGGGAIYAAPIEGGDRELIASIGATANLVIADEFVYAGSEDQIARVPITGGEPTVLFESVSAIGWSEIANGELFATLQSGFDPRLVRMQLDGSGLSTMTSIPGVDGAFCSDAEAIYVVRTGDILRVGYDGSLLSFVAPSPPSGCAVRGGEIYTSLGTTKQIVKLMFGGDFQVIATFEGMFPSNVFQMIIDGNVLHYVSLGTFGRVAL